MTSLPYADYKKLMDARNDEYRDRIRDYAKQLVAEGKTFEDMAELFMGTTKCIAFDHALFCYFLHFSQQQPRRG